MSKRTTQERAQDEERVELALLGKLLPKHNGRRHTKVVGVTNFNGNGTSRQEAIKELRQFDLVELVHNPADKWDTNAVQVMAKVPDFGRVQIGHLDKELAAEIAPLLDRGEKWAAIVTRVGGHISIGVSLMLFRRL